MYVATMKFIALTIIMFALLLMMGTTSVISAPAIQNSEEALNEEDFLPLLMELEALMTQPEMNKPDVSAGIDEVSNNNTDQKDFWGLIFRDILGKIGEAYDETFLSPESDRLVDYVVREDKRVEEVADEVYKSQWKKLAKRAKKLEIDISDCLRDDELDTYSSQIVSTFEKCLDDIDRVGYSGLIANEEDFFKTIKNIEGSGLKECVGSQGFKNQQACLAKIYRMMHDYDLKNKIYETDTHKAVSGSLELAIKNDICNHGDIILELWSTYRARADQLGKQVNECIRIKIET